MVSGVCQKLTSQTLEVSGILKLNLKTKTKIYHEQMSSQNKYSLLQQRINDEMNEKYSPSFQRQEGSTVVLDEIDSKEEYKDQRPKL